MLDKIPIRVVLWNFGISSIIFTISVVFHLFNTLINLIVERVGLFMSYSLSIIDYFLICFIPVFAIYLNNKSKKSFLIIELIKDNLKFIFSVFFTFGITIFILLKIRPYFFIREPFEDFFTLIILTGILIPFIFTKKIERHPK